MSSCSADCSMYSCFYCNQGFQDEASFHKHQYEIFNCLRCSYLGCNKIEHDHDLMRQHWISTHVGEYREPDLCRLTEATCQSDFPLFDERNSCSACGKFFSSPHACIEHIWDSNIRLKCPMCTYIFERPGQFSKHLKAKHPASLQQSIQDEAPLQYLRVKLLQPSCTNYRGLKKYMLLEEPFADASTKITNRLEFIEATQPDENTIIYEYRPQYVSCTPKKLRVVDTEDSPPQPDVETEESVEQSGGEADDVQILNELTGEIELPQSGNPDSKVEISTDKKQMKRLPKKPKRLKLSHSSTPEDSLTCPVCGKQFQTLARRNEHIKDNLIKIKCPLCTCTFRRPVNYRKHFLEQHDNQNVLPFKRVQLLRPSCVLDSHVTQRRVEEDLYIKIEDDAHFFARSITKSLESLKDGEHLLSVRYSTRNDKQNMQVKGEDSSDSVMEEVNNDDDFQVELDDDMQVELNNDDDIQVETDRDGNIQVEVHKGRSQGATATAQVDNSIDADVRQLLHIPRFGNDYETFKVHWEAHRMSMAQYISEEIIQKQKLLSAILKAQVPNK